jgi:hypothetical protein
MVFGNKGICPLATILDEERDRLVKFFGEQSAKCIMEHYNSGALEEIFGSVSRVILSIMRGEKTAPSKEGGS